MSKKLQVLKEDIHFKNESWKLDIKSKNETIKSRNLAIENLEEELSDKKELLKILTKQVHNFESYKEKEMFHQSDGFVTFKHEIKTLNEKITKLQEDI